MNTLALENRLEQLESRKRDIENYKFMGGGIGLVCFIFISMGLGIIMMICASVMNSNELSNVNAEIIALKSQIAANSGEKSQAKEDEISSLKREIEELKANK